MLLESRSNILLSIFLVIVTCFNSNAQNAEVVFNSAAEQYVHGKNENAKKIVKQGLLNYPNDPNLEELLALLNNENNDSKDDKDSDSDEGDENQDKEEGEKDEEKEDSEDKDGKDQDSDSENEEDKDEPKENDAKDGENEEDDKQEPKPIQLTPREAEQLLEAAKNEDQKIQMQLKKNQKGDPRKIEKDW